MVYTNVELVKALSLFSEHQSIGAPSGIARIGNVFVKLQTRFDETVLKVRAYALAYGLERAEP